MTIFPTSSRLPDIWPSRGSRIKAALGLNRRQGTPTCLYTAEGLSCTYPVRKTMARVCECVCTFIAHVAMVRCLHRERFVQVLHIPVSRTAGCLCSRPNVPQGASPLIDGAPASTRLLISQSQKDTRYRGHQPAMRQQQHCTSQACMQRLPLRHARSMHHNDSHGTLPMQRHRTGTWQMRKCSEGLQLPVWSASPASWVRAFGQAEISLGGRVWG